MVHIETGASHNASLSTPVHQFGNEFHDAAGLEASAWVSSLRSRESRPSLVRLAEACAIPPDHINWQGHYLAVPAEAAKFSKPRRHPLMPAVEGGLKEQLRVDGKLCNSSGCYYRKELYLACQCPKNDPKQHIKQASPYTLRHTFGTRFIENGGDIYVLKEIMGHSSLEITAKNYVHTRPTTLVEAARQIDVFTDRRVGANAGADETTTGFTTRSRRQHQPPHTGCEAVPG